MVIGHFMSFFAMTGLVIGLYNYSVADVESTAILAANRWLIKIDTAEYKSAWQETDELFKCNMSDQKWIHFLREDRQSLGPTINRNIISAVSRLSLPGFPIGEYVVLQFDTSFQYKVAVIENLTLKLCNNKWKVVKYYLK